MSGKIKDKPQPKDRSKLFALIIVLFIFAIYGNSIRNEYNLDDEFVTNGNPQVAKGIKAIPEIFTSLYSQRQNLAYGYRPVVKATYAIEYQFFGWNPHISHFFNILLYAICCFVLFIVLKRIFQNYSSSLFLVVVLLFAAHPVHTEVVNSLKNRDEILSLTFSLLALISFIKYYENKKFIWLVSGLILFIIAILSKLNAVTFIIIIPLAIYFKNNDKNSALDNFPIEKKEFELIKNRIMLFMKNGVYLFLLAVLLNYYCAFYPAKFPHFIYYILYVISGILILISNRKHKTEKSIKLFYFIGYMFLFLVTSAIFRDQKILLILNIVIYCIFYFFTTSKYSFVKSANTIFEKLSKYKLFIIISCVLLLVFLVSNYLQEAYLPATNSKVDFWQNPLYFANQSSYIANGFFTLLFYFKILLIPYQLSFYYGYNMIPAVGIFNYNVLISLFICTIILIYAIVKLPKRNILSFAILVFFISISMFSNFYIPVAGIVGERLVFNASMGFTLALGVILFVITKSSFLTSSKTKAFTVVLTCIVLLAYSSKTISRNNDWKERHTLFTADIGHLQNSVKANDLTATLLYGEAKKDIDKNQNISENLPKLNKVIGYYSQALKIYPEHFNASYNIGFIYLMYFRDYDNAIVYLENTIKINKDFMEAYPDLSYAHSMKGNSERAVDLAKIALSKDPNNITNISFLANLYLKKGDFQSCAELNRKIIDIDPNGDIGYIGEGNLFAAKGDTIEAIKSLEKAFEKNRANRNTIISLYNIYLKAGNKEKADYYKNQLPR